MKKKTRCSHNATKTTVVITKLKKIFLSLKFFCTTRWTQLIKICTHML